LTINSSTFYTREKSPSFRQQKRPISGKIADIAFTCVFSRTCP